MTKSYVLSAITPTLALLFFVSFLIIWKRQERLVYVLNWALAFLAGGIGFTILFAYQFFQSPVVAFCANLGFGLVAFFTARGMLLRYVEEAKDEVLVPLYCLTAAASSWLCLVEDSVIGRGVAFSLGSIAMLLFTAFKIRRAAADRLDRTILLVLAASSALLCVRLIASFLIEDSLVLVEGFEASYWLLIFTLVATVCWTAFAVLCFARIATDLMQELARQSSIDPLSGSLNRRGFGMAADRLLGKASQLRPVSLILCDIDHFKLINDTFGHAAGDTVICRLATLLQEAAGAAGIVGRMGGEEFALILPCAEGRAGLAVAEGIRTAFALDSGIDTSEPCTITVSMGITVTDGSHDLETLLNEADLSLYDAKRSGRDRAILFGRTVQSDHMAA